MTNHVTATITWGCAFVLAVSTVQHQSLRLTLVLNQFGGLGLSKAALPNVKVTDSVCGMQPALTLAGAAALPNVR